MSRKKYSKIFLNNGNSNYDFLWVDVGKDSSTMIGTSSSYKGTQFNHAVFDEAKTHRPHDFISGNSLNNPKITFHSSGLYKTSTTIGLTEESIDRCTVTGTPLQLINEPRRMLEILLPEKLKIACKKKKPNDIVLDISQFTNKPIRCSVCCCSKKYFHENLENQKRFYDTSVIEYTTGVEDGKRVWLFSIRQTDSDVHYPKAFMIFLPGKVKWGGIKSAI